MQRVNSLNKYIMLDLLKSDKKINYAGFYKSELEDMLEILREEYEELLKDFNEQKNGEET